MNKVMLWGVTGLALAFLLFPSYAASILGASRDPVPEHLNRSIVRLEGMTCEGCAVTVAQAIQAVPDVLAVNVRYEDGVVVVGSDPDQPIPTNEILAALEVSGYRGDFANLDEMDQGYLQSLLASITSTCGSTCQTTCCPTPHASENTPPVNRHRRGNMALRQSSTTNTLDSQVQAVLQVANLSCPAVKGVGCGHVLAPLLTRLNSLEGVKSTATNWTGSELRVVASQVGTREQAIESVLTELESRRLHPITLTGSDLQTALQQEWWDVAEVYELSAFEFETLMIGFVMQFVESEDFDAELTDQLVEITRARWLRWKELDLQNADPMQSDPEQWNQWLRDIGQDVVTESSMLLTPKQSQRQQSLLLKAWQELQGVAGGGRSADRR